MEKTLKKGTDYTGITVTFACHDGKGNFLFSKRSNNCRDEHGRWEPGGGGVEFGDSIEKTLRKEIGEEYGADVLDFEFLGYRDIHREQNGVPTHWVGFDFKVLIDPAQVKIGEPHMIDELRWVTLDTLPTPTHSQWPVFFEKHKDKLMQSDSK